jgi:hypothetical protein
MSLSEEQGFSNSNNNSRVQETQQEKGNFTSSTLRAAY